MPGYERLGQKIEELRDVYYGRLADALSKSPTPIDQREIDYKRGFWQGALYATQRLPKSLAKDWDVLVAEANKEDEDTV